MIKKLIIIGSALVLCLGALIGFSIYLNNPKVVVENSFEKVSEDLQKREEVEPLVEMFKKGSFSFKTSPKSLSSSTAEQGTVSSILSDISGKIYFSEDEFMLENFSVGLGDSDLNADIYLSEDYSYVSNDDILGGTYGIVLGDMVDSFKDSVFAPGSGSELELPEETYDDIMELLEAFDGKKLTDLGEDISKYVENYLEFIYDSIKKHAEFESEKDEVKVGGERIKARVITVTVDKDVLIAVLEDLIEEIEKDKALRKDIEEYGEYFSFVTKRFLAADQDDILDMYDGMIDELSDTVDSLEDLIPDFKIIFEVVTKKSSSTLLQFNVSAKFQGTTQELLSLDLGKDGIKNTDCIELSLFGRESFKYEVKESNKDEFSAVLKTSYNGETQTILSIDIDKDREKFTVKIPSANCKITGDIVTKSKETTITLGSVYVGEEKIELPFSAEIIINQKDSVPTPEKKNKISNIFDLSDEDLEKIASNAENHGFFVGAAPEADPEADPNTDE